MTFTFDCDDGDVQPIVRPRRDVHTARSRLALCIFWEAGEINGDLAGIEATAGPADCAIRSRVIRDAS